MAITFQPAIELTAASLLGKLSVMALRGFFMLTCSRSLAAADRQAGAEDAVTRVYASAIAPANLPVKGE